MANTEMIRELVKKKGLKYKFIAGELGITATGLKKKIENEHEFKASEIVKMADILEVDLAVRDQIFFN
ncbi:MAG: helix-turn-helix transcriptional regulator [Clostridia bacterium]|nr:helix-turn-helix transcriptional regulator [Clostridia bacterium]